MQRIAGYRMAYRSMDQPRHVINKPSGIENNNGQILKSANSSSCFLFLLLLLVLVLLLLLL